ncbi:hypothetical protein [Shewanella marina]|uniref:hypothetical protein n=1 Tax=Shewanella marina TaxID=487319 RepID=UPI0004706B3E|nr:hypothetical protein [Shewanella marina]
MPIVKRQIYIILVSYYASYKQKAIESIKKFKEVSDLDCKLCVVYNNQSAQDKVVHYQSIIDAEILGSNKGWEFSAWDEGNAWVQENWQPQSNDIIIFANDTFCHHRSFTKVNAAFINDAIKHIKAGQLVGDKIWFGEVGQINGMVSDSFLSSYLFLAQQSDLNLLIPFDKVRSDTDFYNALTFDSKQIKLKDSNPYIEKRLTDYIFPTEKGKGWYNANCNNSELIKLKGIAAINEFLLSFTVVAKGGSLAEFYPKPWMKKVIKIQRKILKRLPKSR